MKGEAKFFASLKETPENGTKKPSAKPGNQVPRVKVLNYVKKVALFWFCINLGGNQLLQSLTIYLIINTLVN